MSGLPQRIPIQSLPMIYKGQDGNYYAELDWYLFFYNLATQIFPQNPGSGGSTPASPTDLMAFVEMDAMTSDIAQTVRQLANAAILEGQDIELVSADLQSIRRAIDNLALSIDALLPDVQSVFGRVGAVGGAPGAAGQMLLSTGAGLNPAFANNPTITGGSIDGTPIGATTPATVTGSVFNSATTTTAAPSGTAVTVYTFPNTTPRCWLVSANFGTSNDTTHYDLYAVVLTDGTSARIAFSNVGSLMAIALSGLNLQITQSSGVAVTLTTVLTRVG